jgi:hypothetical protein
MVEKKRFVIDMTLNHLIIGYMHLAKCHEPNSSLQGRRHSTWHKLPLSSIPRFISPPSFPSLHLEFYHCMSSPYVTKVIFVVCPHVWGFNCGYCVRLHNLIHHHSSMTIMRSSCVYTLVLWKTDFIVF